ncbi:MAG TPA: 7-cyano-7-deazaguanine synthase QueC [Phenylobacterium sp.]|nr:7-cyano-7-deazaguanine synthase QueC [Phenylobacterium sp.]HVI31304.1 7-cyano-7-deazaguanine synthase QueC [Phenylobacterium sp.]
MIETTGALVLFSGGQDSTVCLAWALERYPRVETVGFDYGQRHAVELQARQAVRARMAGAFPDWASRLGEDHMLEMRGFGAIGDTAMTGERAFEITAKGLPSTYVPGRNLVFLTYAAALADRRGLQVLVGGMCETDFSGYPDCRREAIDAMEQALNLGMAQDFRIETPLMRLTKAETWALAKGLGGEPLVELILEESHTCYRGEREVRRPWGYGCGTCPACELRARGYEGWVAQDRPVLRPGAVEA